MGLQNVNGLCWGHFHVAAGKELLNLCKSCMPSDAQVGPAKISQAIHATVGELNVQVHTSGTDESRVQQLGMIGSEDKDVV